jgi:phosphoglycolate phosphatase
VCRHLGVTPLLAEIFGASDTAWLKPQAEFSAHAVRTLGAEASSTVLVGDSIYDLAAAQNGGLGFFGVTTGTHTAEELRVHGATEIFPDLSAVSAALFG